MAFHPPFAESPPSFEADTAVRAADGSGRWLADITAGWSIGDKPNGGYLLATAARAMQAEVAAVASHPHPITITAHYLRPGETGPAEIAVEVLRTGRTLTTATAALVQGGKDRLRLLATFADLSAAATGPTVLQTGPPPLPPPDECDDRALAIDAESPMLTIARSLDCRLDPVGAKTQFSFDDRRNGAPSSGTEAVVRSWIRLADRTDPDVLSLLLFADGLPPAVFHLMDSQVWVPTIELTVHVRAVPAPGWIRAVMHTRFLTDGFFEEDGELWDSDDRLVAQSRQLGMLFRG